MCQKPIQYRAKIPPSVVRKNNTKSKWFLQNSKSLFRYSSNKRTYLSFVRYIRISRIHPFCCAKQGSNYTCFYRRNCEWYTLIGIGPVPVRFPLWFCEVLGNEYTSIYHMINLYICLLAGAGPSPQGGFDNPNLDQTGKISATENILWYDISAKYFSLFPEYSQIVEAYIRIHMSSFWRNFHHWLHWKLSKQLSVQPVVKISSQRKFRFSILLAIMGVIQGRLWVQNYFINPNKICLIYKTKTLKFIYRQQKLICLLTGKEIIWFSSSVVLRVYDSKTKKGHPGDMHVCYLNTNLFIAIHTWSFMKDFTVSTQLALNITENKNNF